MGFFKKIFEKKQKPQETTQEQLDGFYSLKEKAMENVLGKSHGVVGHAIVPFQVGGAVDMYYFPNLIEGTVLATMELIEHEHKGPVPNKNGMYELIAFTKHKISQQTGAMKSPEEPFEKLERRMCGIFTCIGSYSYEVKLEPGETCEIPGKAGEENICLVFDEYKKEGTEFMINGKRYGLLICIEVFRSEMEYAMEYGSQELFKLLRQKGCYPYSDLDRQPVI